MHFAGFMPRLLTWPVVNDFNGAVRRQAKNEKMVGLCTESHPPVALGKPDLDSPAVISYSIVTGRGWLQEREVEHLRCNYLAEGAYEVAVGGEFTTGKECFQTIDDSVKRS